MNFLIPDRWAALAAQYPEGTVGRITLQEKGFRTVRTAASAALSRKSESSGPKAVVMGRAVSTS